MKKRFLTLAAVFLFSLSGCAAPEASEDTKAAEQARFDAFSDEVFVSEISQNIINLHWTLADPESFGITDYELSLGDYSLESEEESRALTDEYLSSLAGFSYEQLTEDQRLTYDIFKSWLTDYQKSEGYRLYYNPVSPLTGDQTTLPTLLAEYKFYRAQDVEDYLEILKLFPDYFQGLIDFQKEKSAAGLFMPDFEVDTVITQCRQFMENPETHYLIDSFRERLDETDFFTEEQKEAYRTENAELIQNTVLPAYEYLIRELEKLKGTGTNEGGLCNYKNGTDFYELLVRDATGSAKSVDQIQELILDELNSDFSEIIYLTARDASVLDTMFDSPVDLSDPYEALNLLKESIAEDFPAPADLPFEVNYVPESVQDYMNPAYYIIPPMDYPENNVIYINPASAGESFSDFATLAHEGFPGHMYQTTYFYAAKPAALRNLLSFSGYTEGWGTYAELYSYTLAGADETTARLNQLNTTFTLALHCLSDIGINYHGWSREGTASFLENFGIEKEISDEIYETMVAEPALYLSYYLGYLEFAELREWAEETLEENFDIKAFHTFLLETGPAPFDVIRTRMELWLRSAS